MRGIDPVTADGMHRHELRSAVVGGTLAKVDVSIMPELLQAGDLILLASDGLNALDEVEIASIVDAAAVVFPRDQLSMPAEDGIGRDQGVPVTAYPSPEARGLCGQAPALGVGEPETARTELLSADAMLFLERVNDVTRLLVDPARDGHDEELQHVGKRRHTGRASQRLSAVTTVATRRASSVESARRTASIGFLDSTGSTRRYVVPG